MSSANSGPESGAAPADLRHRPGGGARALRRGGMALATAFGLLLGACSLPPKPPVETDPTGRTPDAVEEPRIPSRPGDTVERLIADGRAEDAEAVLRNQLQETPEDPRARRLLGLALEMQGRTDEALVRYLSVTGAPEPAEASEAWRGVARLRRGQGDRVGAVRAQLRAWNLADRSDRDDGFVRSQVEALSESERHGLAREGFGAAGAFLGTPDGGSTRADWTVTMLAPLSGRMASFGEAFRIGAELALRERDDAPAGNLRADAPTVRFLAADSEGDPLVAVRAARRSIYDDGADAFLGPLLSVTSIAVGGVAESYGVPMIAPLATVPGLAAIGPHVLTLDPDPSELAVPLAEFAVRDLGHSRFGVLIPSDGIAADYERLFRAAVESWGGRVVVSLAFEPGEKDFRRLIERIEKEEVDALYVPASAADLEPLAEQLEFYDFDRRILGHGGWTHANVLDPANPTLRDAVFCVPALQQPESDFMIRLGQRLRSYSGQEVSRFHVQGYRAMAALLAALDLGARDGDSVAELIRLRRFWPQPLPSDETQLVLYRDGILASARWAVPTTGGTFGFGD